MALILLCAINAARVFCWTCGTTRSWRNGDAQGCQLSNIAYTFSDFFPFKLVAKPYLVSEIRWYCQPLIFRAADREEQRSQLNTDITLLASPILYDASIAEITAQLLSLTYVYLISSVDGSIIRIFVQINILRRRASYSLNGSRFSHYFIFTPLSGNSKIYQWKLFFWEFSCIKILYVAQRDKQMQ